MIFKFMITRPKDVVEVWLMRNKADHTWSFVNVTKGHIYKCKFKTPQEAIQDLNLRILEGKIVSYLRID